MADAPGRPFEKGQSGNPTGRPKGARSKLGEQFLEDMLADWEANGKAAIDACRATKPDVYVKVVASILPKELNVKVSELDELSDDELDRRIRALASALDLEARTSAAPGGDEAEAGSQPSGGVRAVH